MSRHKNVIVYSAVSNDRRTLRFALHPVLDGRTGGAGPMFPCRVAYSTVCLEPNCAVCRDPVLYGSCRTHRKVGEGDYVEDVVAWLLAGEPA